MNFYGNFSQTCLTAVLFLTCSLAQSESSPSAPDLVGVQDSIPTLEQTVAAHPADGHAWDRLASAYRHNGEYDKAIKSFEKAIEYGFDPSMGKYQLACVYARSGDKTRALELLSESIGAGFTGPLDEQPDFATLKGEPQFKQLMKTAEAANHPCRQSKEHPEYRQLDFWLGSWEVFSGSEKAGDSEIKLILGDCVVFENWKDAYGGEGKSFNKYNNATRKWEQFWVEDDGSTQYFTGEFVSGEMRYMLDQTDQAGLRIMRHLTFSRLPQNRVRQFSQKSKDGGKTWVTEYDLTYVPRPQQVPSQ